MKKNPKVTIVIPVYNGSNYLSEAIDSALAQTYTNTEILVINDGSNDNEQTHQIAQSYGDKIHYITKTNGGVATALNMGIQHMTGDYFSWLSHDDLYYPDKVEKQINALIELGNGKHVIYSNYEVFTNDLETIYPVMLDGVPPEGFRYWLTIKNCLHGCTLMIPRSAFEEVGSFNEKLKTTQDYDLWFRMAKHYNFIHTPDILVKSRSHPEQDTHKLRETVMIEADSLFIGFVHDLEPEEIYSFRKIPLYLAYNEIASSMFLREFKEAGNTAKTLSDFHEKELSLLKKTKFKIYKFYSYNIYILFKIKKIVPAGMKLYVKKMLATKEKTNPMFIQDALKQKFSEIYDKNLFAGRKSRSGEGSDLVQTAVIRGEISNLIKQYGIKTFLDAPCGDWYWMSHTDLGVDTYIGIDIVQTLIDKHILTYGNSSNHFYCLDLTTDDIPAADMIFSRDCLVHLKYEDALNILRNFKRSGAKYLLTTTFTNRSENTDLSDEKGVSLFWRPLNMQLSPFNFPKPILLINEGCTEENNNYTDKCLGLWLLNDLMIQDKINK